MKKAELLSLVKDQVGKVPWPTAVCPWPDPPELLTVAQLREAFRRGTYTVEVSNETAKPR